MYVNFEELPKSARVWIYQGDKQIPEGSKPEIEQALKSFADRWSAHGHPLKASFQILYDRFIVLAADEAFYAPSGCSIDDSVRVIREIGAKTGVDFFDRSKVLFLAGDSVNEIPMKDLKEKYSLNIWSPASITFNTLAATVGELDQWLVEAGNTWLKRYTTPTPVTSKAE